MPMQYQQLTPPPSSTLFLKSPNFYIGSGSEMKFSHLIEHLLSVEKICKFHFNRKNPNFSNEFKCFHTRTSHNQTTHLILIYLKVSFENPRV